MSFVDQPSGWQWQAVSATALAQAALLAVFAAAFHVAQGSPGVPVAASIAVFDLPAPMAEAPAQAGELRPELPRPARSVALVLPPQQTRPSALPQQAAPQAGLPAPQAPATAETSPPPPSSSPPLADSAPEQADALAVYAKALRQRIMARLPGGLNRQGAVMVAFTLNTAGHITSAEVAQSSSDLQLDRIALRMVRAAAPFPAPPADVPDTRLRFSIEVRFH